MNINAVSDLSSFEKFTLAASENVSPDVLQMLSTAPEQNIRSAVAENLNTSLATLVSLARDKERHTVICVGINPKTPADVLNMLSRSIDELVRSSVATNTSAPLFTLTRLATDFSPFVRECVARNENCSSDLLAKLANEENPNILATVAANPSLNSAILTKLSTHVLDNVRRNVAKNPSTPSGTVLAMLEKESEYSHYSSSNVPSASYIPRVVIPVLVNNDIISAVASNSSLPSDVLEKLSNDHDFSHELPAGDVLLSNRTSYAVRAAVAANPNTPLPVLHQLAADNYALVRANVAKNLSTPLELLFSLAISKHDDTAQADNDLSNENHIYYNIAKNPNVSPEILDYLATSPNFVYRDDEFLKTPENVYEEIIKNNNTDTVTAINLALTHQPDTTALLIHLLPKCSQTQLMEICELTNTNMRTIINLTCTVTHPLLQNMLNPKTKKPTNSLTKTF